MSTRAHPPWVSWATAATSLVGLLLFTLSCRNGNDAPKARLPGHRKDENTLLLATYADVGTLDPATANDGLSAMLLPALYAGLVEMNEDGTLVPALAERYEHDAQYRQYTFHLRADARFHDGSSVTAQALVASFERAAGPTASAMADGAFDHVLGLADYRAGHATHVQGMQALSPSELRVSLTRSDARFLSLCMLPAMRPVCPSSPPAGASDISPCGAGSYAVTPSDWQRGRQITLHRTHLDSPSLVPQLEKIRWQFQTSTNTQRLLFLRGDLDIVSELSYVDDMALRASPQWQKQLHFESSRELYGEVMNTRLAPFDNVHVRRAVSYAIDRSKFERIKPGSMLGTAFPLPAAVMEDLGGLPCQHYDYEAALREMSLAGYPYDPNRNTGGYPHVIPYLVYAQGVAEYSAQVVARSLERIGLRVEIRVLSYQAYLAQAQRKGASAISFGGWGVDVPDAAAFLRPLFHSNAISDEDSTNAAFYSNPQVDADLDKATISADPTERRQALTRVLRTLCDDAPWAYTFSLRTGMYTQGYVYGFQPHPMVRYWPFHTSLGPLSP